MAGYKLILLLASVCASTTAFTLPGRGSAPPSTTLVQRHGKVSSSPSPRRTSHSQTLLFSLPRPLGIEGDWTAYLDEESTGLIYYFNGKTGESRWEPPTNTFPIVSLPEDMRRKAEVKRLAYIRRVQQAERQQGGETTEAAAETITKVKEEKSGEKWFDFLFEETEEKVEEKPAVKEELAEQEEQPNWLSRISKAAAEGAAQAAETAAQTAAQMREEAASTAVEEKIEVVEPEVTPIKLEVATCVLPHPQKIFWGGEDAVFTAGRTFGVFDGVSGARKLDGVPLYSKTLASEMKKRCDGRGLSVQDMQKFLQEAREIADQSSTGASTALVASITEDGFLRALNVGDSTCVVIRDGRIVSKTREITHFFECPYQLSVDSPDKPRDGTKLNIELVRGDLIVMGSDGVFDNLSDSEILDSIEKSNTPKLGKIAKRLADRSRKVSLNQKAETPYAKLAMKNGDPDYAEGLGGKVDDISCVVVRYA